MKAYKVEKLCLGDKMSQGDQIVFQSIDDLKEARNDIENGNSIYVKTNDGLITELPYRMIYQKIYDGTIKMSAIDNQQEEKKC
jgi:hypothetical protein